MKERQFHIMAMGTHRQQRSKALHNFTLPGELRWGHQRLLHCMNLTSSPHRFAAANNPHHRFAAPGNNQRHRAVLDTGDTDPSPDQQFLRGSRKRDRTPPPDGCRRYSDGSAAMREKVISDLRTEADKIKHVIFNDGFQKDETFVSPPLPPPSPAVSPAENRPWNLRTRRAVQRTLPVSNFVSSSGIGAATTVVSGGENDNGGGKALMVDTVKPNLESSHKGTGLTAAAADKPPPRLRSGGSGAAAASGEKRERPKFSVALSKSDIEEDFLAMVGHRPARRPRKRAKIVQRNLDTLFPGLWLTEVTPNMYKVSEAAPSQGR